MRTIPELLDLVWRYPLFEARKSGAFIVEDDYTSEFRYSGPPLASLQGLDDTEQVIYVGTLNKALFPGLRVGYAVVPRALLGAFVGARYLIDRQPPTLQQAVVSEFMQQGHFAAHIRRMRQLYRCGSARRCSA
jgi:GntR family transcriptional regulator/MocR family aminotransferase